MAGAKKPSKKPMTKKPKKERTCLEAELPEDPPPPPLEDEREDLRIKS